MGECKSVTRATSTLQGCSPNATPPNPSAATSSPRPLASASRKHPHRLAPAQAPPKWRILALLGILYSRRTVANRQPCIMENELAEIVKLCFTRSRMAIDASVAPIGDR